MATPIYSDVITQINTYIIANGNNDITANVLNPILTILADFTNNTIGYLDDLTTSDNENVVAAINSLKTDFDNLVNNGVQLYTGYDDPNDVPPPSYNYADFYMQLDSGDDTPIYLWQWNGIEWTNTNYIPDPFPDQDNIHRLFEFTLAYIGSTDWEDDVQINLAQTLSGLIVTVDATEIYRFKITDDDGNYQIWEQLNIGKGLIPNDPLKLFLINDKSVSSTQDLQSVTDQGAVTDNPISVNNINGVTQINGSTIVLTEVSSSSVEITSGGVTVGYEVQFPDKTGVQTFAMLEDVTGTQDLQSVLDNGNTSSTDLIITDGFGSDTRLLLGELYVENPSGNRVTLRSDIAEHIIFENGGTNSIGLYNRNQSGIGEVDLPNVSTNVRTLAVSVNGNFADANGIINAVEIADDFINDAVAASGGISVGGLYHTSGIVKIRLT